ncbi:hypothetical protein KC342_g17291 [Hortaea werneckii]|nr:hypothetical protein KC342_g17291 [Hortaea werneckii]KAI7380359.1 hypothetical protein KC328_g12841 [Hortaea werneckii]
MPAKQAKGAGSGERLTKRQAQLLQAATQSAKFPIKIDYKAFSKKAGLGSAKYARTVWYRIKKKLQEVDDSNGVAPFANNQRLGSKGPAKKESTTCNAATTPQQATAADKDKDNDEKLLIDNEETKIDDGEEGDVKDING